jgi:predicted O-methyltransferase YrrM
VSNAPQFLSHDQTALRNLDRLLPSQAVMKQFFNGSDADFYPQLERVATSVLAVKSVHDKWDIQLKPGLSYETLGSDLSGLHLLQLLVRLADIKDVLEVGTYVGVSTLFLAEAVGADGRVVTIEVGAEFADIAREKLRRRDRPFDMVFLDGDKASYGRLLPSLLDVLRPGGLMLVDDIFCNGDTLNPEPTTDKGKGIKDMLERVAALQDYARVILPYGNGQLLLVKG